MDRQGLQEVAGARVRQAAAAALAALLLAGPAGARSLEYLYVEPNEGTASGGHVALRIGDRVHHYQHADGALRSARVSADWFRYLYSVLENRTIHVARVEVDEETWNALDDRFGSRAIVEQQHFEVQRALADDRRVLERMRVGPAANAPGASPRLRGAGYFFGAGGRRSEGVEPRLGALRTRVRAERGNDWLEQRIAALGRELAGLDPAGFPAPALELSEDRLPQREPGFSERLVQLTLLRLALEVIESAAPLRPEARVTLPDPGFALSTEERVALARFASRLERDMLGLLDSKRPDRGYPLLVGLARLVVVDESLSAGRWIVLDTFPADTVAIQADTLATRAEFVAELEAYTRAELTAERERFATRERVDERLYQGVEDAANRNVEVTRGLRRGRDIRVHGQTLIPHGELKSGPPWLPELDAARLHAALAEARRRERSHRAALLELYRYDLFTRNCVTELFATIDDALPKEEQADRLGGHVSLSAGLHFWPVFAFGAVKRTWRVEEIGEIPSYRRTRLARMRAQEHPLKVHLREASTLTSSVYRRNPKDSFFLFFTRDAWLLRPLYGAANLLAGVGQTAVGLARLPFDRGETLVAGAKGIVFSVPELAFVSLRKGSLEYARSSEPRTAFRTAGAGGR